MKFIVLELKILDTPVDVRSFGEGHQSKPEADTDRSVFLFQCVSSVSSCMQWYMYLPLELINSYYIAHCACACRRGHQLFM